MKLYFKGFLVIVLLFAKDFTAVNQASHTFEKQLQFGYDAAVVDKTIKAIENNNLDEQLYQAFMLDLEELIHKIYDVVYQKKHKNKRFAMGTEDLDEMLFDYKSQALSWYKLLQINLISKKNQIAFLTPFLFGISSLFLQENKMRELLNDENIGNILFLMSAVGINFSCFSLLEDLAKLVHEHCAHLKTDDIDNCIYEATMYEIFYKLSALMIEKNIFSVVFSRVATLGLNKSKANIIQVKSQLKSQFKDNNKSKSKK